MTRKTTWKQGIYKPINPNKYVGDINNIVYRSSWEKKFLQWCDSRDAVLEYSSEETIVPYYFPLDQKNHRYFVDFRIKMVNNKGEVEELLVEIKPYKETIKPVPPKNNNRKAVVRYNGEVATYIKNQCKWQNADKYAKERNMKFIVLTENQLFGKKLKK